MSRGRRTAPQTRARSRAAAESSEPGPRLTRCEAAAGGFLADLELFRLQPVPGEQLVEVGPIAARELCGLRDVAAGDLEELDEVVPHELVARLVERRHLRRRPAPERALHQLGADDRAGRERGGMLHERREL